MLDGLAVVPSMMMMMIKVMMITPFSLSLFHDDDDHGVDVGHKDIVLSNSYARLFCCIFIST